MKPYVTEQHVGINIYQCNYLYINMNTDTFGLSRHSSWLEDKHGERLNFDFLISMLFI